MCFCLCCKKLFINPAKTSKEKEKIVLPAFYWDYRGESPQPFPCYLHLLHPSVQIKPPLVLLATLVLINFKYYEMYTTETVLTRITRINLK